MDNMLSDNMKGLMFIGGWIFLGLGPYLFYNEGHRRIILWFSILLFVLGIIFIFYPLLTTPIT